MAVTYRLLSCFSTVFIFSLNNVAVGGAYPDVSGCALFAFGVDYDEMIKHLSILLAAQTACQDFAGILAGGNLDRSIH
jgi:hypothetical protein